MKLPNIFRRTPELEGAWNMVLPETKGSKSELQKDLSNGINSDLFQGLANVMPNPDPVLKKLGYYQDVDAYKDLLSDPQLYGAIENNRKPGTTSLKMDLGITKVKKAEAEYFTRYFEQIKYNGIYDNSVNHSLDTPQFGRMVFGIVWKIENGYFIPTEISPVPFFLHKFTYDGKLLVSQDGVTFESPKHPAKYIVLRHKPSLENPYGEAVLARCYWNIRFKRDGLQLWALFMEKFGMPWLKASYKPVQIAKAFNTDPGTAATKLLESLATMAKDGIIVFPEGINLEVTTPKEASTAIYERLVRICDEQNTKLQLGHSGATETTSGDKLSNDTTSTQVRADVVLSDKKYPTVLWNHIIYWIHQFNFSGDKMPKYDLYSEVDVDKALAERDALLSPVLIQSGLKLSKDYFLDKYGFEETELEPVESEKSKVVKQEEAQVKND